MRKLIGVLGLSSFLFAAPLGVLAADMPVKAPPPAPAPVLNWTGFYVGADGGYGWADRTGSGFATTPTGVPNGFGTAFEVDNVESARGWFAGGTAGYNLQAGRFVVGIETDIQWSDIGGSGLAPDPCCRPVLSGVGVYGASENLTWFGTTRARFGWLATPNLLLFGTAGGIYGHEDVSGSIYFPTGGFVYPSSAGTTRGGWTAGGGVEYMFASNWSAKVEGLYYDMGGTTASFTCPPAGVTCTPGFTEANDFSFRGVLVRAGVNWHFSPGAILAKY
jgi:outer membrane immunogenic protein